MFFGLIAVDDHPCCRMQELVEYFFESSVENDVFSTALFPEWMRPWVKVTDRSRTTKSSARRTTKKDGTPRKDRTTFGDRFKEVHLLLHSNGMSREDRRAVYIQVRDSNRIRDLCDGTLGLPRDVIKWPSALGRSISELMSTLYDSLNLTVFERPDAGGSATQQLYREFVKVNGNRVVCPFCSLRTFRNPLGPRREDFDHYLHKSKYPLSAANVAKLIPTCSECNQDYKWGSDILADGKAFYPYGAIPKVNVDVECVVYPPTAKVTDPGTWSVRLELVLPDPAVAPKMAAWDRVYDIKGRLEREIQLYFESWMAEVAEEAEAAESLDDFRGLINAAKIRAQKMSELRMQNGQIIKAAFYEFMLRKADGAFVESFLVSSKRQRSS